MKFLSPQNPCDGLYTLKLHPRKEEGSVCSEKIPFAAHMGQILCVHKTCSYNVDLSFIFPPRLYLRSMDTIPLESDYIYNYYQ